VGLRLKSLPHGDFVATVENDVKKVKERQKKELIHV